MKKLRWGILSTANIGIQKVIPAIQKAANCEVVAISSRNLENAQKAASTLGITKAYASYEALLADPDIDAIYNPLPNHLHVSWTLKALEAGKHVLCEKPIGLNADEATYLINEAEKFPQLKLMEAFMYRFHPQWQKVKQLVDDGVLGEVKTLQSFFSYFNNDPKNIRNKADIGGGALMDIGCYNIQFPRFVFGIEPKQVVGLIEHDPEMLTDRITSGMLDFENGISSSFTCSTQLHPYQRAQIVGTKGRIEIEIPVNAPHDAPTKITVVTAKGTEELFFGPTDQYTIQAEEFAKAVLENKEVPTPFTDAINNMKVIDALVKSAHNNAWVKL
ncbi:MAG: Gfo/Idh/MocA family oxidoreductase [Prolixibacteraceae bacterium]|jgi:predicted dehydrogenase|nr:Gfo/Idh/MocA family oxidoreductase [Prolixibacteraceae bacterium]